jgi:hypothetical protein
MNASPQRSVGPTTPASLPGSIRLLSWGVNQSTNGPVILDNRSLAVFAANQKRIGRERVPLDFEHNTVPGTPEYERTSEPRAIAAMAAPVLIPNQGLFLTSLSYTPDGTASASGYEDVSAAPFLDQNRVVVGLHSAALTRAGAVDGAVFKLAAFSAQSPGRLVLCSSLPLPANRPSVPLSAATRQAIAALSARLDGIELLALSAAIDAAPSGNGAHWIGALKTFQHDVSAYFRLPKGDVKAEALNRLKRAAPRIQTLVAARSNLRVPQPRQLTLKT